MKLSIIVAAAALAVIAIAPGGSAADMSNCDVIRDQSVTEVNGFYMQGTAHAFYEESNGIPSLQRYWTFCTDGRAYRPDTCIIPSDTIDQGPNCLVEFVDGL